MCPSYARVSRAVRRARASVTRRLPSNGRSRRLPPVNHSSHPSHPRALRRPMRVTHTSYSSLDPLLIRTHTHPLLNVSDRPRVRPTESSTSLGRDPSRRRFTTHRPPSTPAADARRAHYTHTHARTHPSRAPTHAHRTTRRRFVRLHASDRPRRSPAHSPRGHRARTARPPPSSSVHTNVEHSF